MAKNVNEATLEQEVQPAKKSGKKAGMVAYKVYITEDDNRFLLESADGRQPNDWLSRLIGSTGIAALVGNHQKRGITPSEGNDD